MRSLGAIAAALGRRLVLPFRLARRGMVRAVAGVTRLLPTRFWLEVRDESRLMRPMDYRGGRVYLGVDSCIEHDARLREAGKEPGTVQWIEEWFRSGEVFFDIGANVGSFSLIAFRFLGGRTRIYAFEPGFMTFPQLCRNIHLNRADQSIAPFQVALSNRTGVSAFHYRDLKPGSALHALEVPRDWRGKGFEPVLSLPILSYRLDDFIRQFELPGPNHLKIDVDGMEYQILQGAEQTLRSPTLRSLLMEANEDDVHAAEAAALLAGSGLELHARMRENCLYIRP